MKLFKENSELIEALDDNLSLISSQVKSIRIFFENGQVSVDVILSLKNEKQLIDFVFRFSHVEEYLFVYQWDYSFYDIEIVKFFKGENFYYLSLDPIDEVEEINDQDQDFIKAEKVAAYFIE